MNPTVRRGRADPPGRLVGKPAPDTGSPRLLPRTLVLLFLGLVLPCSQADHFDEDFTADPATRGWKSHGDPTQFRWNPSEGHLEVTWDSRRPNAFFHHPLPTVLTRADAFRFRARLVLADLATESPATTFQLAVGLQRHADAVSSNFFRGAGINPTWGPRNLVEFDYFPASQSIAPSLSAVAVATQNTRWATLDLFPFELEVGRTYDIELRHEAADATLHLQVHRDGEPLAQGSTVLSAGFGDFRVDTFSVSSYSGDHQPAGYGGHLLAHGTIDDVFVEFPTPPRPVLEIRRSGSSSSPTLTPTLAAVPGWTPILERQNGSAPWEALPITPELSNDRWTFPELNALGATALYRIRLDRP